MGISLLATDTNGIDQMCLATTRRTKDKERIKSGLTRMFCYRQADRTRQFIAITFNEVLECLLRIELGIELLRCCGIQDRRSLVASSERTRAFNL